MSEFADLLLRTLNGVVSLADDQVTRLEEHYALLERWNRTLNLTAVRALHEAVVRHYAESVFLGTQVRRFGESCSAVDIGSGAGFPGFPIAVVLPSWHVTLVESHQRKAVFLRESTRELRNVSVLANRFEAVLGNFDVGVSRAVAWRDIQKLLSTRVRHMALLIAATDALQIGNSASFNWDSPISVPWNREAVVLLGQRSST